MKHLGTLAFWLTYPGIWLLLFFSKRTRALLIHNDSFLVVKGWLGPDRWGLPGGGLHRGEQPLTGLIREVREETGIDLDGQGVSHAYQARHRGLGLRFTYDCFICRLQTWPDIAAQKGEITAWRWVPLADPGVKLTADAATALDWWKSHG